MFGFRPGLPELLVILFIILLIFGASRLPQLASSLGKGIRLFKKGLSGEEEEKPLEKEKPLKEKTRQKKALEAKK